ncbi:MAG: hypothetical protein ACI9DO_002797, partial [Reinekea sp.]
MPTKATKSPALISWAFGGAKEPIAKGSCYCAALN